ncbi:hypothetical protein IVB03_27635 [Bradyrhizobium sp. 168]|uniref:hypothetical protein n=1 Tax=Bradyrhizobium sp. 168 TaxID=2782639 RepID=UPI001FFB2920|nr:hypothetical protein [Bradyrhizobium sp. 168]MCK1583231.1 hypothetical protein [Bradyrhizobium sp. 168]
MSVNNLRPEEIRREVDRRLAAALRDAAGSALGMPGSVDTFTAMLDRADLALVLKEELRP